MSTRSEPSELRIGIPNRAARSTPRPVPIDEPMARTRDGSRLSGSAPVIGQQPADLHGGGTQVAAPSLPIVIFLSACCEGEDLNDVTDNGAPLLAWIEHLVRQGSVVIFPRFDPRDPMTVV